MYPNKSYLILPPPPALGSVRQDSDDPLTLAANVLQHLLYTLLATADRPSIPQKTLRSTDRLRLTSWGVPVRSPREESTLKPSESTLKCSTTKPQRLKRISYLSRVLHTVRISNVDRVMICK